MPLACGAPVETAEVLSEFVRDEAVVGTGKTRRQAASLVFYFLILLWGAWPNVF